MRIVALRSPNGEYYHWPLTPFGKEQSKLGPRETAAIMTFIDACHVQCDATLADFIIEDVTVGELRPI